MNLKNFIFILFILISFLAHSQKKMSLKFNDGTTKIDVFKANENYLISIKPRKKYKYKDIKEILVHDGIASKHFFIVEVKSRFGKFKRQRGLASKIYSNTNIDVYHIIFGSNPIKARSIKTYLPKAEIFAKQKNEGLAYSIGTIDGHGWYKTKERLQLFFKDCPKLFAEMKRIGVHEKQTLKILKLYTQLCGTHN